MQIETHINAPPAEVWAHLSDLASHARWMSDAESVEFLTDQRAGVGTSIRVPTRVGPFRSTDLLTVTTWDPERLIEASHEGVVTGIGSFEIQPGPNGSILTWREDLEFPWWMGGRLGHALGRPVLRAIWARNLARFKELVEAGP